MKLVWVAIRSERNSSFKSQYRLVEIIEITKLLEATEE
jgi:hypothetical protein